MRGACRLRVAYVTTTFVIFQFPLRRCQDEDQVTDPGPENWAGKAASMIEISERNICDDFRIGGDRFVLESVTGAQALIFSAY
jgi:hypothetical protein